MCVYLAMGKKSALFCLAGICAAIGIMFVTPVVSDMPNWIQNGVGSFLVILSIAICFWAYRLQTPDTSNSASLMKVGRANVGNVNALDNEFDGYNQVSIIDGGDDSKFGNVTISGNKFTKGK